MTDQVRFFIAEHQIDLARSVVIFSQQETKVEPKILQVLYLLAQKQGEVVSHQEIMTTVWQGTEVVPNALQRCIARLRKVLGDDAKSPNIIATHPKIGYRLMQPVRWYSNSKLTPEQKLNQNYQKLKEKPKRIASSPIKILALVMSTFLVYLVWYLNNDTHIRYQHIETLTHSAAHESFASFNPNASYIVFNRSTYACQSHIWAKHVASGLETRLTSRAGFYQDTRFTPDGRSLVFVEHNQCDEQAKHDSEALLEQCWRIATLDFAQALNQPQQPTPRFECGKAQLRQPIALENHQYAFLRYQDGSFQLQLYDDLSKQFSTLYRSEQDEIYHLSYHQESKKFALLSNSQSAGSSLILLNEQGEILANTALLLPDFLAQNQRFDAQFSANGTHLLATSYGALYRITFDGKVSQISTPQTNLSAITVHPNNSSILAITGRKDIDIAEINVSGETPAPTPKGLNRQQLPYPSLARATSQDRHAKYQPNGALIAFISNRSGQDQIWLWQGEQTTQLSNLTHQHPISQFSWSPDGKQLAVVSRNKVNIINLTGKSQQIDTKIPLNQVLAWVDDTQLFVTANRPSPDTLFKLNIKTAELTPYPLSGIKQLWAFEQTLFYSDENGGVFKRSLDDEQPKSTLLPELNGKSMLPHNGEIVSYSFDSKTLNRYDFDGQFIEQLAPLKAFAWKITDARNNKLLLEQVISLDQNIALLKSE